MKHIAKITEGRDIWIFKIINSQGFSAVADRYLQEDDGVKWVDSHRFLNPRKKRYKTERGAINRIKREIIESHPRAEIEWIRGAE